GDGRVARKICAELDRRELPEGKLSLQEGARNDARAEDREQDGKRDGDFAETVYAEKALNGGREKQDKDPDKYAGCEGRGESGCDMPGIQGRARDDRRPHAEFAEHLRERDHDEGGGENTEVFNRQQARQNGENRDLNEASAERAAEGEVEPFERVFRERFRHR